MICGDILYFFTFLRLNVPLRTGEIYEDNIPQDEGDFYLLVLTRSLH